MVYQTPLPVRYPSISRTTVVMKAVPFRRVVCGGRQRGGLAARRAPVGVAGSAPDLSQRVGRRPGKIHEDDKSLAGAGRAAARFLRDDLGGVAEFGALDDVDGRNRYLRHTRILVRPGPGRNPCALSANRQLQHPTPAV